ncbi:MAG: hypothetical protein WC264_03720 [Candidatus Paceibacterota bacterium]|jgi:hypothetical protein
MSKKEKMTIIGKGLENLQVLKKQKEQEEKLYTRRSINIKGHTLKLRSKIGDLIITDIQANKNGTIVEITLQNSENKEFEIKLKNSEENDNEIKTSWEQKNGNIIQLIFPKEKNNEEEIESQRTVEVVNDIKTQIQKAPDDVKKKENIIINEEKKEEVISKSPEKEEKKLDFSFQIAPDGPIKEFKKGEEFELKEVVSKNGEPEKIEIIKYKIEGVEKIKNGTKLLWCLNLNKTNKKGKVLSQDYTRFSERNLKDFLKQKWINFYQDEKFKKEYKEWQEKKNALPEKKDETNEEKKEEKENQKIFNEINKLTEELTAEAPVDNLEDAKDFYEHMLKNNRPALIENAKQNLEKIKKIEELMGQREIIEKE